MFIATTTDGLTKIGQKLLQQSIESYVYTVLGAQAKTRWSIVGEGAKSLQTQDVFHTIVKEMIAQSDVTITISNMRTAIASTNVILNMAISPDMILVPSNLIIQKKKIPGYNNILMLATDKMKFGKNTEVHYKVPAATTQEVTKTITPSKTTQVNSVDDFLKYIVDNFKGTNSLIILDDCAATQVIKNRVSELVKLVFSARHYGFSTIVLTQQMTSIAKPYRENISKLVSFYNPSKKDMQTITDEFLNLNKEEVKDTVQKLKNNKYARLEILLRHPYTHEVVII